jgi:PKD repeat protein
VNVFADATSSSTPSPLGPANVAPVAAITEAPLTAAVGQTLTFGGTATDADGPRQPRPYWDFGDATAYAFGTEVTHAFTKAGTYKVRLYACDSIVLTAAEATVKVE